MLGATGLRPTLRFLHDVGLVNNPLADQALSLLESDPFSELARHADSVHLHVKVRDVRRVPYELMRGQGGVAERQGSDYVKYRFPPGMNLICSSDLVAEDDLIFGGAPASLPFVDHLGIDVRQDSPATREAFEAIPGTAAQLGWRCLSLAGPVVGSHAEVTRKHWLYPPEGPGGLRRPVEVAFGPLFLHDTYLGCDLRPIDPAHPLAESAHRAAERRHRLLIRRWPERQMDTRLIVNGLPMSGISHLSC